MCNLVQPSIHWSRIPRGALAQAAEGLPCLAPRIRPIRRRRHAPTPMRCLAAAAVQSVPKSKGLCGPAGLLIIIWGNRERLLVQDRARTATAPRGRRPKSLRRSRPIDRNQTRRGLPRVIRDPSGDPTQNTMVSGGCPRNRDRRRDHLQGYPGRWKHPNFPNGHGDIVPKCLISALGAIAPPRPRLVQTHHPQPWYHGLAGSGAYEGAAAEEFGEQDASPFESPADLRAGLTGID